MTIGLTGFLLLLFFVLHLHILSCSTAKRTSTKNFSEFGDDLRQIKALAAGTQVVSAITM